MLFVDYIIVLPFVFTNDIELSFIERSCALIKKKCDHKLGEHYEISISQMAMDRFPVTWIFYFIYR
jgi:hypothetical protein